jgi:hypothetical protein
MIKFFLRCSIALLGIVCRIDCYSQDQNNTESGVAPYYIDFNSAAKSSLFQITAEYLHIQYRDIYGSAKTIPLTIFNWKHEKVAEITLAKEFGLNHFEVDLKKYASTFSKDEIYTCDLVDEKGKVYSAAIRYAPAAKIEISLEIFVRPVQLQCGNSLGENMVEFYGNIGGGKAPYEARWYVLNDKRTEFLYQPKEVTIDRPGNTSSIQVDKSPEYFVLLYVKDACGNEQKKTVQVTCEAGQKKINTLFLQYLNSTPLSPQSKSHN